MHEENQILRYELWHQLKTIFNSYADCNNEIKTSKVQEIVRNVLGQVTTQQISYVVKNMFRLDAKQSGWIDFLSFGNFLFKRHCGEIALQNMHKKNMIQKGNERKINLNQFFTLVNNAYAFLNIKIDVILAESVFKEADQDQDGYITYVEYFHYIEKCICQTKAQFDEYQKAQTLAIPLNLLRKWNSKTRKFLWENLKNIFETFMKGQQDQLANDTNLRSLITTIFGKIAQSKITYLLNGLSKLQSDTLQFTSFAALFINLVAEIGVKTWKKHNSTKQSLNKQQFISLLRNTYKFLHISQIKTSMLSKLFKKIDSNHDGQILMSEYLDWVKNNLAVAANRGDEYYLAEDDEGIDSYDICYPKLSVLNIKKPFTMVSLTFSSYQLSDEVMKKLQQLLTLSNSSGKFNEKQISELLNKLFQISGYQLDYSLRSIFKLKNHQDKYVSSSTFANFCVEQCFGEIIMQRLYQQNVYSKGNDRIMNLAQFQITLNTSLSYIELCSIHEQIQQLFKQIDVRNNGWISFEHYFLFLLYYFGSLRGNSNKIDISSDKGWADRLSLLSPIDRFIRLLFDQLVQIFSQYDLNGNMIFEKDYVEAILHQVFELTDSEVSKVILKIKIFTEQQKKNLNFVFFSKILLQINFIEIIFDRQYKTSNKGQQINITLTIKDFINLMTSACTFLKVKPSEDDLTQIFKKIDINTKRYITYEEYCNFIKTYIRELVYQIKCIDDEQINKSQIISSEQQQFINQIQIELKIYFSKYDVQNKGYLIEEQLTKLLASIFQNKTQQQTKHIIEKYIQSQPHPNSNIQLPTFASFILLYCGQLALQKYHQEQTNNRQNKKLNEQELLLVLSNAFAFLVNMGKFQKALHAIYIRIGMGSQLQYVAFLRWIKSTLLLKFK